MTTERLLERARRCADLRRQAKELEAQADAERVEIVAELQRRGARKIEGDGLVVTLVQRNKVTYDVEALRATLRPAAFRRVTTVVVEPAALRAQVEAGAVTAEAVEAASTVQPQTPYITVRAAA